MEAFGLAELQIRASVTQGPNDCKYQMILGSSNNTAACLRMAIGSTSIVASNN